MKREIVTEYVYPPIPDRSHDWCAYDQNTYEPGDIDGETGLYRGGGLLGWGATESEAIADLERLFTEMAEYEEQLAEDRASKGWAA